MLPHAAANIQNLFPVEIREHGKQDRGLNAVIEIDFFVPAALETFKKCIIVIDILLGHFEILHG